MTAERHRLPGDRKIDDTEFLDLTRRVGYRELEELAGLYLDGRVASLLAMNPNSDESRTLLAKAQGVRDFLRWLVSMQRECETRKDGGQ